VLKNQQVEVILDWRLEMENENRNELLAGADDNNRTARIVEEEVEAAGDKPNTCRACAGSSFC
jgi:hypothetical protein